MSPTPKKADLLQVQRYVDGELSPDSRTVFEARLQEEPALLKAVEAAREQSQLFQDDPAADLGPPRASVMNAVMDQVQRLPRREPPMQLADEAATVGRRWLVAAAVLLVAALLFGFKLIQPPGPETAQAAAEDELRELDDAYRHLQSKDQGLPAALDRHRSGR